MLDTLSRHIDLISLSLCKERCERDFDAKNIYKNIPRIFSGMEGCSPGLKGLVLCLSLQKVAEKDVNISTMGLCHLNSFSEALIFKLGLLR